MKWLARAALVIGVVLGLAFAYWWTRIRRIPTLRFTHTLGRGSEVNIEWIELT